MIQATWNFRHTRSKRLRSELKIMIALSNSTASIHDPEDLLVLTAERELSAFFTAVTELFGPEEAMRASEDWLQQLEKLQSLSNTPRQFRLITISASEKLAKRVTSDGSEPPTNTLRM
jgi:hypothetical protein